MASPWGRGWGWGGGREGWGYPLRDGVAVLTSSLTETSWLRATLPSMLQAHQVACHVLGRLLQNQREGSLASSQPGLKEPMGRQADSSLPSPQLTLALNSTDLTSWWWAQARHQQPPGPFARVL